MKEITTCHLVLEKDINHHRTLFAGRASEWTVEAGFLAATTFLHSKNVVCVAIQELHFHKPVHAGESVSFQGSIVKTGRTSVVSFVKGTLLSTQELFLEGLIKFVYVDEEGRAKPHGFALDAEEERKPN